MSRLPSEPDPVTWTPASRAAFLASELAVLNGFTDAHLDAYAAMHTAWRGFERSTDTTTERGRERRRAAYEDFRKARAAFWRLAHGRASR